MNDYCTPPFWNMHPADLISLIALIAIHMTNRIDRIGKYWWFGFESVDLKVVWFDPAWLTN